MQTQTVHQVKHDRAHCSTKNAKAKKITDLAKVEIMERPQNDATP